MCHLFMEKIQIIEIIGHEHQLRKNVQKTIFHKIYLVNYEYVYTSYLHACINIQEVEFLRNSNGWLTTAREY